MQSAARVGTFLAVMISRACIHLASIAFILGLGACTNVAPEAAAVFRSGEAWPDDKGVFINAHGGGMYFEDGVYYWFGEHKIAGDAGNKAHAGVHAYSSRDLANWKDEGIVLAVSADLSSPIARECILERPKVVRVPSTGKYVMWFHLERRGRGYGDAMSGVAIADKVTGPYAFVNASRQNAGKWPINMPEGDRKPFDDAARAELDAHLAKHDINRKFPGDLLFMRDFAGGQMARDMTLFADDDGKIYHLYSSEENGTLHISELAPDGLSASGRYIRVFRGKFNEAPAVMKHDGRYYLFTSGCTGWAPNAARLAVADSMLGEWTYLGNPCRGTKEEVSKTFGGQSTYVLPVAGMPGRHIFMGDLWRPANAIDGRYLWLPVEFEDGHPILRYRKEWSLAPEGR